MKKHRKTISAVIFSAFFFFTLCIPSFAGEKISDYSLISADWDGTHETFVSDAVLNAVFTIWGLSVEDYYRTSLTIDYNGPGDYEVVSVEESGGLVITTNGTGAVAFIEALALTGNIECADQEIDYGRALCSTHCTE